MEITCDNVINHGSVLITFKLFERGFIEALHRRKKGEVKQQNAVPSENLHYFR